MKIFDLAIENGSFRDRVSGTILTATGTPRISRTEKGLAYKNDGNANYLELDRVNNLTNVTLVSAFKSSRVGGSIGGNIAITNSDGNRLELYLTNSLGSAPVRVFANGFFAASTATGYNDGKWHLAIYTFNGTTKKLYIDGSEVTLGTDTAVGTTTSNKITIGKVSSAAQYFDGNLTMLRAYDNVLSSQEINNLYQEFLKLTNSEQPVRNFTYLRPTNLSYLDSNGLIMSFNKITKGVVTDISGNYTLLNKGPLINNGGVIFNHIANRGVYTSTSVPTTNTETLQFCFRYLDNSGTALLYRHFVFNTGGYQIYLTSTGQLVLSTAQLGAGTVNNLQILNKNTNNTLTISIDNSNSKVYSCLNGVTTEYSITPYASTTANLRVGDSEGAVASLPMILYDFRQYNRILSENEMIKYHNDCVKPVYNNNLSNLGADNVAKPLSGFIPVSGSFKVNELNSDNSFLRSGNKYIECVTSGQFALESQLAYGTWEFDWYKGSTSTSPAIGFALPSISSFFSLGYAIQAYTDESIRLYKNGSVSGMFYTVPNYIQNNVWYRSRVVRDNDGKFTVYIKGGNFTPTEGAPDGFTLVGDLVSGNNPVTDNTYKTSNFIVFKGDVGDRIANLKAWNARRNNWIYVPVPSPYSWSETQPAGNVSLSWQDCALSSDGQKMIACDINSTSGVYFSTNSGTSWTKPTLSGTSYVNCDISIDGSYMVASSGSNNYESYDGITWTPSIKGKDFSGVSDRIRVSQDGNRVIVTDGDIWYYNGSTWSEMLPGGSTIIANWRAVDISNDGTRLVVGGGDGTSNKRIYVSQDSGSTWTEVRPLGDTDQFWTSASISNNGQTLYVSNNKRIYKSIDGGTSWTELQPAGDVDKFWGCITISKTNPNIVIAGIGISDKIYQSTNGGASWSEILPAGSSLNGNWNSARINNAGTSIITGNRSVSAGRLYIYK